MILYENNNCNSSSVLKIEGNETTGSSDLTTYFTGRNLRVESISNCDKCLIQQGVGNWRNVEEYAFTFGKGYDLNHWMNGEEMGGNNYLGKRGFWL